jgi:hypothetical protein
METINAKASSGRGASHQLITSKVIMRIVVCHLKLPRIISHQLILLREDWILIIVQWHQEDHQLVPCKGRMKLATFQ